MTSAIHLDHAVPVRPGLSDVIRSHGLRTVFQPIVDLTTGAVVGHEALTRGPEGPWESPMALFGAAREQGLLAELDAACRSSAFEAASESGLVAPLTVFVNVEPEVLARGSLHELEAMAAAAPSRLRLVLEITERALATRPAELLATVDRMRECGWAVALDDVGAEPASLAFMALLRPDVVKLDLALTQAPPSPAIAEVMHAVNAYAERSGAIVLAEGIETEAHVVRALALGARLGQGWRFGRPTAHPHVDTTVDPLPLAVRSSDSAQPCSSPFCALPDGVALRRSPKRLLVELSKELEREAARIGPTAIVAATFQYAHHFTPATAVRYADLVERTGFVCALGEGLVDVPVAGLRGAPLEAGDPVIGEWDVVVLSAHFSAALLARDLGDDGPDMDRMFEYALTYDRGVVTAAAHALLSRVAAV